MDGLYHPRGRLVWMFRHWDGRRQVRESLKTRDEAEAIRRASEILRGPSRAASGDYETEIAHYLAEKKKADRLSARTRENRNYLLPRFFEEMGKTMVRDITKADAQKWYDALRIGEESRQTYCRWLKTFFKWLCDRGKLRDNPFAGVQMARARPQGRKRTLTKAQVATLIERAPTDELRFVLFCGFHAGMRKEEVIEARPEWFDLAAGHIHIDVTPTWIPKDRERRAVPISKAFGKFLKTYGRPSPYMLAPEVKSGRARYRYDFRRPYTEHLKACGIQCTFHDARRTFASLAISGGVSPYKVAKWLGDGIAVVERHYGHLVPEDGALDRVFG